MARSIYVSAAILVHNSAEHIHACIDAVLAQTRPPDDIVVIDNASTDETVSIVENNYPMVRIERFENNTGCSGGRNRQLIKSRFRHVMIIDHDAVLDEHCLEELEKGIMSYPDASIWSPRICYDRNRNLVQYDGGKIHFTGETVAINPERVLHPHTSDKLRNYGSNQVVFSYSNNQKPLPHNPFIINVQGGVAYMIDRKAAMELGGYDETYFFGRSDGELSFRLTLSGRIVYCVPKAIAYHRIGKRGFKYIRNQIRNRWILILTAYSWRTIILIAPMLFFYECSLIVFLSIKRRLRDYFSASWEVLRSLPQILEKRKRLQPIKKHSDGEVLSADFINMRADVAGNKVIRNLFQALNILFRYYWLCVRRLAV